MTQISHPTSALENYTQDYSDLFKDKRLFTGFQAIITGILGSGSTRIAQIAKSAPQTGTSPHSEQRLRRLIHNKNQRADLTPAKISNKFTTRGAKRLAKHDEVKVILDGSDLRKPYSTSLEYLDTVLDLNGNPVAGYPTLNAIGIGQNGKQALLYHKTYSSLEAGFKSEREEIRIAIQTVTSALRAQGVGRIIWILDRGFDGGQARQVLLQGQEIAKSSIGFSRRVVVT